MLITAFKSMSWFYCPSSACKKSVCVCSTELFPALMTYYILLKFMYSHLSRMRQTAKLWCLWWHYSNAEDKIRGRLSRLSCLFPYTPFTKPPQSQLIKIRADNWAVSGYHSKCALQSKWQGSEEGLINSIMFPCWNTLDFHSIIWWGFPTTFPREHKRKAASLWRWPLLALQAGTEELMLGGHAHTFRIFKRGSSYISWRISSQLLWFNTGSNKSSPSTMCAGALLFMTKIKNKMMNASILT